MASYLAAAERFRIRVGEVITITVGGDDDALDDYPLAPTAYYSMGLALSWFFVTGILLDLVTSVINLAQVNHILVEVRFGTSFKTVSPLDRVNLLERFPGGPGSLAVRQLHSRSRRYLGSVIGSRDRGGREADVDVSQTQHNFPGVPKLPRTHQDPGLGDPSCCDGWSFWGSAEWTMRPFTAWRPFWEKQLHGSRRA